jgi:transketolase
VLYDNDERFRIGGSKTVRTSESDRLTLVGAGITLHEGLKAAEALAGDGIAIRVIDAYSVKPIDAEALIRAVGETGQLLVVEDHYFDGGLGDAVLNAVGSRGAVEKMAVQGVPRSGSPEELIEAFGIGAEAIARRVRELVG